jgi:UDP-N-acetylmuramyl pentapeptide phosphotransferase/UDP-N-acetylglucosamine-1-phosphate transferase
MNAFNMIDGINGLVLVVQWCTAFIGFSSGLIYDSMLVLANWLQC